MFDLAQESAEGPPRWRAWALIGKGNQLLRLHHDQRHLLDICLSERGERVEEIDISIRRKS